MVKPPYRKLPLSKSGLPVGWDGETVLSVVELLLLLSFLWRTAVT
jgi:hypothetical protein